MPLLSHPTKGSWGLRDPKLHTCNEEAQNVGILYQTKNPCRRHKRTTRDFSEKRPPPSTSKGLRGEAQRDTGHSRSKMGQDALPSPQGKQGLRLGRAGSVHLGNPSPAPCGVLDVALLPLTGLGSSHGPQAGSHLKLVQAPGSSQVWSWGEGPQREGVCSCQFRSGVTPGESVPSVAAFLAPGRQKEAGGRGRRSCSSSTPSQVSSFLSPSIAGEEPRWPQGSTAGCQRHGLAPKPLRRASGLPSAQEGPLAQQGWMTASLNPVVWPACGIRKGSLLWDREF